jgi:2-C-methyl-D-erythritol 4-phosphate cytidylyltransferase/2-C-methyl-D-erythritol 2,4-cyclodiphosphate synthase
MKDNSAEIFAIIVAGGKGRRLGCKTPKQYLRLGNGSIIYHSILSFIENPNISNVICVIAEEDLSLYKESTKNLNLLNPVFGGKTRQDSVRNGLEAIKKYNPNKVLIHDAARPFISQNIINEIIEKLKLSSAVIPAVAVSETLKKYQDGKIKNTISRKDLYHAQTPQAFDFKNIFSYHLKFQNDEFTDDASIAENAGMNIKIIQGSQNNFKITTKEDYQLALKMIESIKEIRTGIGYDVHKLLDLSKEEEENNHIKIGGINIKYHKKFKAHSDGDVLIHAIIDAILGAICEGDIGEHFPDNDEKFKNYNSGQMLKKILPLVKKKNAEINNLDCTIICEKPNLSAYKKNIEKNLSQILNISVNKINVKAKTNEKLGYLGKEEAIASQAVCSMSIYEKF